MQALYCRKLEGPDGLAIEEIADPVPEPDEVAVDIHAAGLNFPDTLLISGKYQIRPELPFIPGGEAAGTISRVGGDVSGFAVGQRVIMTGATGAFAEKICKRHAEVFRMPDSMDFETGAGFLAAYGTSYYALKQRARLQEGETLLVLGAAGGVGLAAVDLGRAMGATVIAAASSDEKLDTACRSGASERINYSSESLKERAKELTGGKGVDVVYDPVGGPLAEQALRATGWDGRYLVVGFAAGEIPRIPLNLTLLKNNSIVGVFYGAWAQRAPDELRENVDQLFAWFDSGTLAPLVSRRFSLHEYRAAFSALSNREARGKLVFRIRE